MTKISDLTVNTDNPLETVENFLVDKLFENSANVMDYYEENRQEITDDFLLHFIKLCKHGESQQRTNLKAPITYIHVSFLRSSLLTEGYEFRIGLHNKNFWLDIIETSVYWKADFIFQYVEPDINEVRMILKPFPNISEYEINQIKYRYAQCYLMPVAFQIVQDVMYEAVEIPEILHLEFDEEMFVLFGGYMERGENI